MYRNSAEVIIVQLVNVLIENRRGIGEPRFS